MLGRDRVLADVLASEFPENDEQPLMPHERIPSIAQYQLDLPWIRLAVPFWVSQIVYHTRKDNVADHENIQDLHRIMEEAITIARERGFTDAFTDRSVHLARISVAMATEDEALLSQLLRTTRDRGDKRWRDDTAQILGDLAHTASLVVCSHSRNLGHRTRLQTQIYWMAWRAALNDAYDHALLVAQYAAERYADDPAFVEEYEFMVELFAEDKEQPTNTEDTTTASR